MATEDEYVINEVWNLPIRITNIKVGLDYIVVSYDLVEEPYILCHQHLRTWREAEHE